VRGHGRNGHTGSRDRGLRAHGEAAAVRKTSRGGGRTGDDGQILGSGAGETSQDGGYFGSGLSVRELRLLDGSSLLVSSDEGMFVIPIEE
jgi:hypothetical protein